MKNLAIANNFAVVIMEINRDWIHNCGITDYSNPFSERPYEMMRVCELDSAAIIAGPISPIIINHDLVDLF